MIVGTAGHIDHGKTTLVRALTGMDADRLPEEKQRGLTIELGYAFLDAPSGERLAFIDVPGHEKLVHTMVAGAGGIDYALLLVAADDGPMPQTREHLAVLSLLGVREGAVVITKTDRADAERVRAVESEMRALLVGTPLADAPVVAVSAQAGDGVEALRQLLFEAARRHGADAHQGADGFRLAIDRVFSLSGVGTVVTGTVHAGSVHVGDEVTLAPAGGGTPRTARVRSVHAQDQNVPSAHPGQRCALALVGLARDEIARGQWMVDPAIALHTGRLDVRLTLWREERKALRSGAHQQMYLGAGHCNAAIALLDCDTLAPGESALAQLITDVPVAAWWGERFILRDPAANRTLAGGAVLDPFAPTRYRRTPERLAVLHALERDAPAERLRALVDLAPNGVDLAQLRRAQGLVALPMVDDAHVLSAPDHALGSAQTDALVAAVLQALADFHASQPNEVGPDRARLRRLAAPRLAPALWNALLDRLLAQERARLHGAFVHLPEHAVELSATETRIVQKITPALTEAGFQGAWARDLARASGESEPLVRTTLARLARRGDLHQVVKDLYFLPDTMQQLATLARGVAQENDGEIKAADFRDATEVLGRKRAIQILEYFDRIGLTHRVGDLHRLRPECRLFP